MRLDRWPASSVEIREEALNRVGCNNSISLELKTVLRKFLIATGLASSLITATPGSASVITNLDLTNLNRPNFSLLIESTASVGSSALVLDNAVRSALGVPGSVLLQQFGLALQAAQALSAVLTLAEVSNATTIAGIARAVSGISSWDPYVDALSKMNSELSELKRARASIAGAQALVPAGLEDAVVLSREARSTATATLTNLNQTLKTYRNSLATLEEIKQVSSNIADGALMLSNLSLQVAEVIAESGALGGILYPNLISLISNSIILGELVGSATDTASSASNLITTYRKDIDNLSSAFETYSNALQVPMAKVYYDFTSSFPSSPPSRCGFNTSFHPNNFSMEGLDAMPRFIIGAYTVTLTNLAENFQDGCQGKIDVQVSRTIMGIPSIGTSIETGSKSVDYLYSVRFAGIENLYLLSLGKIVDFAGIVGESQSFFLQAVSPLHFKSLM
jgi:hypothetical protein